jgi:autotransporter-associated beta strand protein
LGSAASVVQNEGSSSSSLGTITFNLADGVTSNSTSNFFFRDSSNLDANFGKLALVKTGNGTLDFSTMNATNQGYSGGLTVNGGTFSYNSTAATAALGNSTAGGTITLGGGTLNYTGSTAQSISNNITLTAATTSTLNNANSNITVSGTISGTGNITKGGAGTLTLSGNNTYIGTTSISDGGIIVPKTNGASTGTATFTNTTLSVSFNVAPTAGMTFRYFSGATTQTYASITLVGAPGRTGTYNSANSTLTIA